MCMCVRVCDCVIVCVIALRQQQVITPVDFDKYMQFHAQHKLFLTEFAPSPFNYAGEESGGCGSVIFV